MKRLRGLCLSLAGLMLMTTPALAADYNFETPAPKDFYGSTSYEEVYGAQYNYGGTNAVDFLDPLADSAPGISINSGSSLEYGINSGSGSIYPDSSAWEGNIGLCGHNRGSSHNIGAIKDLEIGDTIRYQTSLGTRTYAVSSVKIIDWTDWSYLNSTSDNRITIITCLANQPTKRVCVQGIEISS